MFVGQVSEWGVRFQATFLAHFTSYSRTYRLQNNPKLTLSSSTNICCFCMQIEYMAPPPRFILNRGLVLSFTRKSVSHADFGYNGVEILLIYQTKSTTICLVGITALFIQSVLSSLSNTQVLSWFCLTKMNMTWLNMDGTKMNRFIRHFPFLARSMISSVLHVVKTVNGLKRVWIDRLDRTDDGN